MAWTVIGTTPVFAKSTGTVSPTVQSLASALSCDTAMPFTSSAAKSPDFTSKSNMSTVACGSAATRKSPCPAICAGPNRNGVSDWISGSARIDSPSAGLSPVPNPVPDVTM